MKITKYDTVENKISFADPTIFLAGPTVRGNQTHLKSWRRDAEAEFLKQGFDGQLIAPEFPDRFASDQKRYDLPVWEFYGLKCSHCILFWIPRTRELIGLTTNHEIGYWMARHRDKVIYGRPKDAYRMEYLDIMWVQDSKDRMGRADKCPIYSKLEDTVSAAIQKAKYNFDFVFNCSQPEAGQKGLNLPEKRD